MYKCGSHEVPFPYPPYVTQQKFIETALDTLDAGGLGVLEAPTGSGKSLSVLTATMTWLLGVLDGTRTILDRSAASPTEADENVPAFVREWDRRRGRERIFEAVKRRREEWTSTARRQAKRRRKTVHTEATEDVEVLSAEEDTEVKGGYRSSGSDDDIPDYEVPKVIFASRTHSQLNQFLTEMQKSVFWTDKRIKVVQLASRQHLCVNPHVKAKASGNNERLVELCNGLGHDCPYRNRGREKLFAEALGAKPHALNDIEDLGTLHKTCPYYTTRRMLPAVQLVLLPYATLLDTRARAQVGLELTGSIVVIDEAHNLINACGNAMSVVQPVGSMQSVLIAIDAYVSRRGPSLLARTKTKLHDVRSICERIINHVGTLQKTGSDTGVVVLQVAPFLQQCGIDNYNLFHVASFIEAAGLDTRLGEVIGVRQLVKTLNALASDSSDSMVVLYLKEDTLKVCALSALKAFAPIVTEAISVLLVGGTLPPIEILAAELFLPPSISKPIKTITLPHVVPPANVYATCFPVGPTRHPLRFTYSAKKGTERELAHETGRVLVNLINIVPKGMVVFFTSYSYLEYVKGVWQDVGVLVQIERRKQVLWERSKMPDTEGLLADFRRLVDTPGGDGAILCGVMGGKLSEGINFADAYGRCVVVVGLPYANPNDVEIAAKLAYLKASGKEIQRSAYYDAQCMTIVNQTIGRVIRHAKDYAAVVLLDDRMVQPRMQAFLPQWIQKSYRPSADFAGGFQTLRGFFHGMLAMKS